ncbi:MAG: hypothetical protein RL463_880 [Bacteroidota bacterium]|jgi:cobalamin biosynthesis Mg chelatase CobN
MCGCNQLSSFNGETQNQFGLDLPTRVEYSNFWPFTKKETSTTPTASTNSTQSASNTDATKTSTDTTKTTSGQKIKGAINDGTVKNTSEAASSWLDTINKGINIFSGKTPVNSPSGNNSNGSDPNNDNSDNSTGIPNYVWWIVGGLALLGAIWAGIHFSKQA